MTASVVAVAILDLKIRGCTEGMVRSASALVAKLGADACTRHRDPMGNNSVNAPSLRAVVCLVVPLPHSAVSTDPEMPPPFWSRTNPCKGAVGTCCAGNTRPPQAKTRSRAVVLGICRVEVFMRSAPHTPGGNSDTIAQTAQSRLRFQRQDDSLLAR